MQSSATRIQLITRTATTVAAAIALAGATLHASAGDPPRDSLERLRSEGEQVLRDSDAGASQALAERAVRFATQTEDTDESLSALRLADDLCHRVPPEAAARLQAQALRRLASLAPRSGRARLLLTEHFLPPLADDAAQSGLPAAVRRYDALLDDLASGADEATQRDLILARCMVRIAAHRTCAVAWLDEAERRDVDRRLASLAAEGGESPDGAPWSDLVAGLRAELRETPFGREIGQWSAPDLGGRSVALHEYSGQIVVLSFWSSWCLPCLEMVPQEADLLRRLGPRGVVLVGVNSDASPDAAAAAAVRHKITWPQLHAAPDQPESLVGRLHIREWPSVIVLDRRGAIAAKFVSSRAGRTWSMSDVERAVVNLLDAPGATP